jgi:hypothetical protein
MDKHSVPTSHDATWLQYKEPHSSLAIICNHSTWDIGFYSYINVILCEECSQDIWHIALGTSCINTQIQLHKETKAKLK